MIRKFILINTAPEEATKGGLRDGRAAATWLKNEGLRREEVLIHMQLEMRPFEAGVKEGNRVIH